MRRLSDILSDEEILKSKVELSEPVTFVTSDSKKVEPGSAFFAIKGTSVDGHGFLPELESKATRALIVETEESFEKYPNTILVKSSRRSYAEAAASWYDYPSRKLNLVGITGTNGKTTITYLLKTIWESLERKTGVIGTVNNQVGGEVVETSHTTPGPWELQELLDRMVQAQVTHVALEVTSIALDQHRTAGCAFKVALFTNLTQDHLDYHKDFESYFKAKLSLFQDYPLRAAIVNIDDPYGAVILERTVALQKVSYGFSASADFSLHEVTISPEGSSGKLVTPLGALPFHLKLIGKHNLLNFAGAMACAYVQGFDLKLSIQALENTPGAPGRLERVENSAGVNVFVDYAHTDDALKNVLTALRELRGGQPRKIVTVFGCGGDRDRTKRPKMAEVASTLSDVTIATSDNPRTEDPMFILDEIETGVRRDRTVYHREVDRKKAIEFALSLAKSGDIVLIAGKGHETYQILGKQKFPFDDRHVVRDYYS